MRNTRLYLNVPYPEKDDAKALGAKWDHEIKKWYVTYKKDYHLFERWFFNSNTNLIISNHLYIAVANRECFKCKKQTPVISFASDTIVEIQRDEDIRTEIWDGAIHFVFDVEDITENLKGLKEYLKTKYNFYYGYSNFTNSYYYGNHCSHCDVLQGNFYLHGGGNSPFSIHDIEDAKNINLLKFKLDYDLELNASFSWCSTDELLEHYSNISDLIIN